MKVNATKKRCGLPIKDIIQCPYCQGFLAWWHADKHYREDHPAEYEDARQVAKAVWQTKMGAA